MHETIRNGDRIMTELERMQDQLKRAYEGNAWYGPGLVQIIKDVTPEIAFRIPAHLDRSIAASMLHMMVWMQFSLNASSGSYKKVTDEETWPKVSNTTLADWDALLAGYKEQQEKVLQYWSGFPEEELYENVDSLQFTHYFLFHGVIQHNIYHTAQIALIKRNQTTQ
jgi:uncharacterized damage-inducible protein DinB